MSDDLHITSLVVHALPEHFATVGASIAALAGAQIHGTDANGKFVVTLEGPTSAAIVDQIGEIQQLTGVVGVAMVYQHAEPLESLNTELPHVDHTT